MIYAPPGCQTGKSTCGPIDTGSLELYRADVLSKRYIFYIQSTLTRSPKTDSDTRRDIYDFYNEALSPTNLLPTINFTTSPATPYDNSKPLPPAP